MNARLSVWNEAGELVFPPAKADSVAIVDLDLLPRPIREMIRVTGVGGVARAWLPPAATDGWKPPSFPGGTLIFEIEIVGSVNPVSPSTLTSARSPSVSQSTPNGDDAVPPPDLSDPPQDAVKTIDGLIYLTLAHGSGNAPTSLQKVKVSVNAWAPRGITLAQLLREHEAVVTAGSAPAGLGQVLAKLAPGGTARVWLPPQKASQLLPESKGERLIVDVTLLGIQAD